MGPLIAVRNDDTESTFRERYALLIVVVLLVGIAACVGIPLLADRLSALTTALP